jgi:hypothetical protein
MRRPYSFPHCCEPDEEGFRPLESRILTLLFAGTDYYQLKAEVLRTGFGIPVPLFAKPGMERDEIADALKNISQSSWTCGVTGADVDRWLDSALPAGGKAVVVPSNHRPRYSIHASTLSPPVPKSLSALKSLHLIG